MWLARECVGDGTLAGPLNRDLICDGLEFDQLGVAGLWDYIEHAPPGTAIHHTQNHGWAPDTHLLAELLSDFRELLWRYRAIHFVGGKDVPYPDRIPRPEAEPDEPAVTWATVELDDMMSPQVRAMMQGGSPFLS
jgi:hypothetical protein